MKLFVGQKLIYHGIPAIIGYISPEETYYVCSNNIDLNGTRSSYISEEIRKKYKYSWTTSEESIKKNSTFPPIDYKKLNRLCFQ